MEWWNNRKRSNQYYWISKFGYWVFRLFSLCFIAVFFYLDNQVVLSVKVEDCK